MSESNDVLTLVERLWESDVASSLTNEAARRIEELEAVLRLIDDGGLHSPKWLQERIRPVLQPRVAAKP